MITGIAHGKLDPAHPDNAGIVDLKSAPKDADGKVAYSTDVVILRPKNAANAKRVLFCDVVNRGSKIAQSLCVGGGALDRGPAPSADFPLMLRQGYTVVWSGWQGDVAQSGKGATAALSTSFPIAKHADGSSITGLSRAEFISNSPTASVMPLTWEPANPADRSEVSFTVRQPWIDGSGRQNHVGLGARHELELCGESGRRPCGRLHQALGRAKRGGRDGVTRRRHDLQLRLPRERSEGDGHRVCGSARPGRFLQKRRQGRKRQPEPAERHEDRRLLHARLSPSGLQQERGRQQGVRTA